MQELLTLKAYSEGKDDQAKYVAERDKQFEQLLEHVKAGTLDQEFSTDRKIAEAFGPPILTRNVEWENQPVVLWLYRYQVKYFNSDKVYLYFDAQGNLIDAHDISGPSEPEEKNPQSPAQGDASHGQDQG